MDALQRLAVEFEHVRPVAGFQLHGTRLHVEQAYDELVPLDRRQELLQLRFRRDRLEHELQRAAAREAETCGLVGGHAVGDDFGLRAG